MSSPMDELLRLRASIDNLDAVLLHTLAERFKLTKQVGVLKAENALPPSDKQREAEQSRSTNKKVRVCLTASFLCTMQQNLSSHCLKAKVLT